MTPSRRSVLLAVAGILLVQAAWVLALPPFRGMDEFDHVYRAYGVAHGQWRLGDTPDDARGPLVDVPASLVAAADDQCESLRFTTAGQCGSFGDRGDGLVAVGTSAGQYNPVFYAVVGTVGRVGDGAGALYAMRVAAGLSCLLLLALAFGALRVARRSPWTWLGLVVGISPTFAYSTVVVAPNGTEMAAGVAAWATLLALFARDGDRPLARRTETWLLLGATTACAVLVTLRTLGPLWLLMIAACVVVAAGPRTVLTTVRARPRAYVAGVVAIGALTAAAAFWTWWSGLGATSTTASEDLGSSDWTHALQLPLWTLQAVASVPYRNTPAPGVVYPLFLLVLVGALVLGARWSGTRLRRATVTAAVLGLGAQVAVVAATLSSWGDGWQGRYALPFLAGVPLLALWRPDPARAGRGALPHLAVTALAAAQVLSLAHMQRVEQARDVSRLDDAWLHGPVGLSVLVLVSGFGLLLLAWRAVPAVPAEDPTDYSRPRENAASRS